MGEHKEGSNKNSTEKEGSKFIVFSLVKIIFFNRSRKKKINFLIKKDR